jgi:hypothetical protein
MLDARKCGLPPGMVVCLDGGDGTQLAVDYRDPEQAILRIMLGVSPDDGKREYVRFAELLFDLVRRKLSARR